MVMKTNPFQNPLKEPEIPTATIRGYEKKVGSIKEATRLVDGATQTERRARKKKSGIKTYWRKERAGRGGLEVGVMAWRDVVMEHTEVGCSDPSKEDWPV